MGFENIILQYLPIFYYLPFYHIQIVQIISANDTFCISQF